jgi:acid phosphatase
MRTSTILLALTSALVAQVAGSQPLPHPKHIVVVIEENKSYEDVIESKDAPYLNNLVSKGALLKKSYGLHHPSQPNYLELFSGNKQGVCNDVCPATITAENLAASLVAAKKKTPFIGYAENFDPSCGPTAQEYAQKHCPWRDFKGILSSMSKDFKEFPKNFDDLPAVAFVIPNLFNDMHSVDPSTKAAKAAGPHPSVATRRALEVQQGDTWLQQHLDAYVTWAMSNNSILIITWDEDHDTSTPIPTDCKTQKSIDTKPPDNHIPTIIVGQHVKAPSTNSTVYTHYNVLRTIEDMEGIPAIGGSKTVQPITGIWN